MVEVLKNVTLHVRRGELTLLAGPSGSGKTTLLTIMGLLLKPTSGKIVLLGREVTALGEAALPAIRRRHIGFIFQGFNLLSSLNAVQNVEVALGLQGVTGRQARRQAMELLQHVGLEHRWRHRPAAMSGGEKQRVAVARALASPAELVLADEPTGNLDSNTGSQVIATLQQLAHEQNRAVLVVTHDQSLFTLADRIVRLRDGRILDDELVYRGASAKMPA
ncbi:MAG: ABC transporter ATP-binding protein [Phycisphaerae bacterium]|nr:ABC transporter ATP-binding protein [Phycisphaerae bacterium]